MRSKLIILFFAMILLVTTVQGALIDELDYLEFYHTYDDADLSGATVIDQIVRNNGTESNMDTSQWGVINEGFYSDNADDNEVQLATTLSLSDFTISFWINFTDNWGAQNEWNILSGTTHLTGQIELADYSNPKTLFFRAQSSATECQSNLMSSLDANSHHVMLTREGTNLSVYIDGSYIDDCTVSNNALSIQEFWHYNNAGAIDMVGYVDEVSLWNKSLNLSHAQEFYNGGVGNPFSNFTATPSAGTNFSVTATDEWNSSSLNITVWIGASTYGPNTTVTTDILDNSTSLYNITIGATNYFNRTYLNYNVSSNLAGELHQAEVCFNASEKVSEGWVTADNFTIDSTTQTCFNLSAGSYNVMAQKSGWYSQNQTFIVSALQNNTQTVQNLSYANLTIYAIDGNTNQSLSGYNLTILSLNHTGWTGETASGVTNHSFNLINGTYNVTIAMPGYAITYSQANITVSGDTNYTFVLYLANSVSITIRDEITNNLIYDNITVRWSDNATTWENVTNTGTLFVSNISAGNYTLLFYSSNYSTRTYTLTVGPSSHQFLTAYMISSTYSTIFTIKDIDTGSLLDGVAITMYKLINSTWTTVESKVSDISGKAQFYYDPIANYRFYLSASEYEDYVFYLNPILFSTYDVYMTKTTVLNYSVDFDDISFIYSPTTFNNNANVTMNFLISSPTGQLTNYGIKVTYPGGTDLDSGVNAIGEQLTVDVNITNATAFDYVVLEFNYTTSLAGTRSYTFNLPINMNVTGGTWLSSKDKTYGMGIFERMLIATIIILFVVGIATMVGQALPGAALGLFVYGFLVFIGFIPLWAILPSMLVGVLFLIWKSGGY